MKFIIKLIGNGWSGYWKEKSNDGKFLTSKKEDSNDENEFESMTIEKIME